MKLSVFSRACVSRILICGLFVLFPLGIAQAAKLYVKPFFHFENVLKPEAGIHDVTEQLEALQSRGLPAEIYFFRSEHQTQYDDPELNQLLDLGGLYEEGGFELAYHPHPMSPFIDYQDSLMNLYFNDAVSAFTEFETYPMDMYTGMLDVNSQGQYGGLQGLINRYDGLVPSIVSYGRLNAVASYVYGPYGFGIPMLLDSKSGTYDLFANLLTGETVYAYLYMGQLVFSHPEQSKLGLWSGNDDVSNIIDTLRNDSSSSKHIISILGTDKVAAVNQNEWSDLIYEDEVYFLNLSDEGGGVRNEEVLKDYLYPFVGAAREVDDIYYTWEYSGYKDSAPSICKGYLYSDCLNQEGDPRLCKIASSDAHAEYFSCYETTLDKFRTYSIDFVGPSGSRDMLNTDNQPITKDELKYAVNDLLLHYQSANKGNAWSPRMETQFSQNGRFLSAAELYVALVKAIRYARNNGGVLPGSVVTDNSYLGPIPGGNPNYHEWPGQSGNVCGRLDGTITRNAAHVVPKIDADDLMNTLPGLSSRNHVPYTVRLNNDDVNAAEVLLLLSSIYNELYSGVRFRNLQVDRADSVPCMAPVATGLTLSNRLPGGYLSGSTKENWYTVLQLWTTRRVSWR